MVQENEYDTHLLRTLALEGNVATWQLLEEMESWGSFFNWSYYNGSLLNADWNYLAEKERECDGEREGTLRIADLEKQEVTG